MTTVCVGPEVLVATLDEVSKHARFSSLFV